MTNYQHILVATDFSDKCGTTLDAAQHQAKLHGAKLSIAHFIEPLPATAFSYTSAVDVEKQRSENATKNLKEVAGKFDVPEQDQYTMEGLPKSGITHLAKEIGADLIVVGSHGHNPILKLLGSTAHAVSHHAHCDVLIVR